MEEIGGCLRPFVVSLASETRQRSLHGCCWPYQVEGVKHCDVTNAPSDFEQNPTKSNRYPDSTLLHIN